MRKIIIVAVIAIGLVSGATLVFTQWQTPSFWPFASRVEAAPVLPVKAKNNMVIADAKLLPVRYATLSMATGGIVDTIPVHEGQVITASRVLVKLDETQQWAAYQQAAATLDVAKAHLAGLQAGARPQEIATAQAGVEIAQAQLKRLEALKATPEEMAVAQAEVRRAQAQLAQVQAGARPEEIAIATAQVAAAEAALQQAHIALSDTALLAPFAGTVAALHVQPGERVMPGEPIAHIADTSAWQVETEDLSELDIVKIHARSAVIVHIDAIPDLRLSGSVSEIRALGENKQGELTYTVLIQLNQYDARLRWNMSASVEIVGRKE